MKNKLLLLFLLLFLTGCDSTYNLEITDEKAVETTTIVENDSIKFSQDPVSKTLFEIYSEKPIPISIKNSILPDSNQKLEGVQYYQKTNLDNDTIGMKISSTFDIDELELSTLANSVGAGFSVTNDADQIILQTKSDIQTFDQYKNLDKLTIKISTDLKVTENNADSINEKTYIWRITRDNCADKKIYIKIQKSKTIEQKVKDTIENADTSFKASNYKEIFIIVVGIIIIVPLVYFIIRKKQNDINRF